MVKTRLMQSLPSAAVTSLYRCLLQDTLRLANSLSGVDVAMMCPEADRDELAEFVRNAVQNPVEIVAQNGPGLAAGLTSVFRHFASAGNRRVIAFNSDSPHIAPSVLHGAFEILSAHDLVIGPTHDGGYYLVGANASHTTLFEGEGMGTRSALDRLIARASALQLSTGYTEPFYDVDIANDLVRLAQELRDAPTKAPRTAAWLAEWQQAVAQLGRAAEAP